MFCRCGDRKDGLRWAVWGYICVPGSPGLAAIHVGCLWLSRPSHQVSLHTCPKMGGKGQTSKGEVPSPGVYQSFLCPLTVVADMLSHEGSVTGCLSEVSEVRPPVTCFGKRMSRLRAFKEGLDSRAEVQG